MTDNPLQNITILLYGTKHSGNVGSAARAMSNMGIGNLALVSPQCAIDDQAYRLAKAGGKILSTARVFESLEKAVADLHLLVGTTGKVGGKRSQTCSPRKTAPKIISFARQQNVGILFGPEDTGLVDEHLAPCQVLVHIPTSSRSRSINLAQAVMVVSYELRLAQLESKSEKASRLPPVAQVEAMYAQLEEALRQIGYLHPQNAEHMMFALRRILGRAELEPHDVGIFRGIARQISWYGKKRSADPLQSQ
jgi:TrmH family RNA methyltransferase